MHSTAELLTAFFAEATLSLKPWVVAGQGHWTLGLLHHGGNQRGNDVDVHLVHSVFAATAEFQVAGVIGELSYGDRECDIGVSVSPYGRPARHGLWEWADAVGRSALVPRNTSFVNQPERLRELVRELCFGLQSLAPVVATAAPDVLERMAAARALAHARLAARWREAEHRGTVKLAQDAFRLRNWARVVELLSSVEDVLTPADTAKLNYALRMRSQ